MDNNGKFFFAHPPAYCKLIGEGGLGYCHYSSGNFTMINIIQSSVKKVILHSKKKIQIIKALLLTISL